VVDEPSPSLGEIIRRQRELGEMSMRQFADLVGISNPYLSQIERGLRAPSERVVDAIADALRTTSLALYEQAGLLEADAEPEGPSVPDAIRADPRLAPAQRRALLGVYEAFVAGAGPRPPRRRPPQGDGGRDGDGDDTASEGHAEHGAGDPEA
jgi:transcriptional regulator with XRE-family HTH domain